MGAAGVLRQKEKLHSPSVGAKVPGWPGDFSSQASGLSMSKIKLLARRSDWLDWLWCLGWGQSALTSGMLGRQGCWGRGSPCHLKGSLSQSPLERASPVHPKQGQENHHGITTPPS